MTRKGYRLCRRTVNEGQGRVKNPQNPVNVVYEWPLLSTYLSFIASFTVASCSQCSDTSRRIVHRNQRSNSHKRFWNGQGLYRGLVLHHGESKKGRPKSEHLPQQCLLCLRLLYRDLNPGPLGEILDKLNCMVYFKFTKVCFNQTLA